MSWLANNSHRFQTQDYPSKDCDGIRGQWKAFEAKTLRGEHPFLALP